MKVLIFPWMLMFYKMYVVNFKKLNKFYSLKRNSFFLITINTFYVTNKNITWIIKYPSSHQRSYQTRNAENSEYRYNS